METEWYPEKDDWMLIILEDEDFYWEYPIYKSTDRLVQWLIDEMLSRGYFE